MCPQLTILERPLCKCSFSTTSLHSSCSPSPAISPPDCMDKRRKKQAKVVTYESEEVSSIEWEFINMTEQEEDMIYRMYKLVGDKWNLIAGRIPGRKPEEIERFWIMRHGEEFATRRRRRSS